MKDRIFEVGRESGMFEGKGAVPEGGEKLIYVVEK